MNSPESSDLPTPNQLNELRYKGLNIGQSQAALRTYDHLPGAEFFMPREVEGYNMAEDSYYWTTRFIGRVGIDPEGNHSLKIKEAASTCYDKLTEVERTIYSFVWNDDRVLHASQMYRFSYAKDPAHIVRLKGVMELLTETDDEAALTNTEDMTKIDTEILASEMQDFALVSSALQYRALGVSGDMNRPGRIFIRDGYMPDLAPGRETSEESFELGMIL
jgi:hypothetical protein